MSMTKGPSRRYPLALLALLGTLVLSGCASAGSEATAGYSSPGQRARSFIDEMRSEEGDEAVSEQLNEHRQEIEEVQSEREEDPNAEVAQEAQAEGAEARETIENEEAEDEAEAEGPEVSEREPGVGRLLREG
jgi:gas vesicle protein